jgi:DNA-binding LytR/AlgR family response regulator
MNPRALIAEDEPLLAQALAAQLARAWPALAIAATVDNGVAALERIVADRPDIAFLDIRMPGLTGLDVAEELADRLAADAKPPLIVFVTAYDEFAVRAFELAAFDYLLKPVDPARLERTVERLQARLAEPAGDTLALAARLARLMEPGAPPAAPLSHLRAGVGNTVRMIALDQVCFLQATDKYVTVATPEGDFLLRTSLKDLAAQLPPARFRQIHRGTIVNVDEIAAAVRDESGRLSLTLRQRRETLAVSRVYAEQFKAM